MVFDDLVVEVSKDALVVIDQPEEASSNVAKLALADGETRGDLTFSNEQNGSDIGEKNPTIVKLHHS